MQLNAPSRRHLERLRKLRKVSVRWFVILARSPDCGVCVWNNATIISCVHVAERADKNCLICLRRV